MHVKITADHCESAWESLENYKNCLGIMRITLTISQELLKNHNYHENHHENHLTITWELWKSWESFENRPRIRQLLKNHEYHIENHLRITWESWKLFKNCSRISLRITWESQESLENCSEILRINPELLDNCLTIMRIVQQSWETPWESFDNCSRNMTITLRIIWESLKNHRSLLKNHLESWKSPKNHENRLKII